MRNELVRTLLIGAIIGSLLASNAALYSAPASAQTGSGPGSGGGGPFGGLGALDPIGPFQLPTTSPSQIPQQQNQTRPPSDNRQLQVVTNQCPGATTVQVASVPRARPGQNPVQTVDMGARTLLGPGAQKGQKPDKPVQIPEFEEVSTIEAAFQSSLDSFLGFSSTTGVSPTRAFAQEMPQYGRTVSGRQSAGGAQTQGGSPPLQTRVQQLEARVQQLADAELQRRAGAQPGLSSAPAPAPLVEAEAGPPPFDPFSIPLRQYGYALFSSEVSTFAPVDSAPVGPDYVVGPGDDLFINVWGPTDSFLIRTVDRDGRIILPKVGDLRVWGLTFTQADRLIRDQLSRYFRGYQTSVTMGRLRTIRVHVVGEVCQPGSYVLSSLSNLTTALFSAGGPTKLGSLRDVRLIRSGRVVGALDLYDFLQRGDRTRDYRVESGDTIFVPTIGAVAAVVGEVKRPSIYEIRGDVRLSDVIEMAGGVTPGSYLRRVQVVRSLPSAERITLDVDLAEYYLKGNTESNPPVNAGDLVLIHRSDPRIYNTVKIEGAVKYPGAYELKPMMRVSQLLTADRVLPEAFPERVEIARRRPDYSVEILSVNLKKAWGGDAAEDVLLKPLDEVTVRTELREAGTVTLSGQVVRPGRYTIASGERLSSVLQRAGGFTERAFPKGAVFTRASLRKVEQEQLENFVSVQEQKILSAATTVVVGGDKEDVAIGTQAIQARLGLLRALSRRVAVGRMVVRLAPPEALKASDDDLIVIDGDTLDVPEPSSSVLVVGAVRNSTSVVHSPGANVEYYINRVGGYATEAEKKEVHVVKADGSGLSGFANLRAVEPGDTIVVPPKEEVRVRVLPTIRDALGVLGSTLTTVLSVAALSVLFH